ncbi:MAG: hypothetical protein ACTSXP_04405 [Promethearchaeota archaeon]
MSPLVEKEAKRGNAGDDGKTGRYPDTNTWKIALGAEMLLFCNWLVSANLLREFLRRKSIKTLVLSMLSIAGCTLFIAFGLLAMLDGPEVVQQLLAGNWSVYSQTLLDTGINTYFFLSAAVILLAFVLPLIITFFANIIRKKENRSPFWKVFLACSHAILPVIFYSPLIFVIAILSAGINPQFVHLLDRAWWDTQLYMFLLLIIIALFLYLSIQIKLLQFSKPRSTITFFILFCSIVAILIPFIL